MTMPFWCLAIVAFMPYLWAFAGGFLIMRSGAALDNKDHRGQQASLEGAPKRAFGAHYNANEATAPFAAGVIVAHLAGADPAVSAQLAQAYVACRLAHGLLYLADRDALRSLAFFGAIGCNVGLFVLAAQAS